MRILVVSLLFPLPTNVARGTFVSDNVKLLESMGHEIKVVNPLPRMLKYQESSRSTLTGVSRAPKQFTHGDTQVITPRFWGLPGHPYPTITIRSMKRIVKKVQSWLGEWSPEIIVCHTIWPAGDLASRLAKQMGIPWVGIVHGHDFDVSLNDKNTSSQIIRLVNDCDHLITVSSRLHSIAKELGKTASSVISCHTAVEDEWLTKPKQWQGRWRKSKLDILFPADPRRREKNHFLALQTGEELETRGWVVGITTLRQQPRTIVWDRMLVADLTLITSKRESGPLVARESLACGTPVVSVNVGEVSQYLSKTSLVEQYDPIKLADACEDALQTDWSEGFKIPNEFSTAEISKRWSSLLAKLLE